jgi:hypothetical protein
MNALADVVVRGGVRPSKMHLRGISLISTSGVVTGRL